MVGERIFYYAVFKKLQCAAGGIGGGGHMAAENDPDFAGGFSLKYINHPNGILGELGPGAGGFGYPIQPMWKPINLVSNDPLDSPLYAMLLHSLDANPPPEVTVPAGGNQSWPVMPLGGTDMTNWQEFNAGSPKLIEALADWIATGDKVDDSPTAFELTFDGLAQNPPPTFPLEGKSLPILYVASYKSDDGRRPGDSSLPKVPANHVPDNFWATSRIFLTDAQGKTAHPLQLKSGEEYCVTAVIGNCGNVRAGRPSFGPAGAAAKINVRCEAQAFNTFLSPGVSLPSLGNLDPLSATAVYEQYSLMPGQRDVVGFRFNVDKVFAGLQTALAQANINLGGATPAEWLANSHPCVKVRIMSGEPDSKFKPADGAVPALDADPRIDRHIAQRNLAPFQITLKGAKQIKWTNFIVAQSGALAGGGPIGANKLFLQHSLPGDGFGLCLAMPKATYDKYVKAGGISGWEAIKDLKSLVGPSAGLPFHDCVVLRETTNGAHLTVGNHHSERFLGMSLGIAWDPAKLKPPLLSETVTLSQAGVTGEVVGGFTLGLQMK